MTRYLIIDVQPSLYVLPLEDVLAKIKHVDVKHVASVETTFEIKKKEKGQIILSRAEGLGLKTLIVVHSQVGFHLKEIRWR